MTVLLLDESLNKTTNKKQIDVYNTSVYGIVLE